VDSAVRSPPHVYYQAGDLYIDVGRHRVTRDSVEIALPNLSFDLLLALAKAHPRMLTTDELLDMVWSPTVVNPETVGQRVKLLRQALGDDPRAPRYVVGVRGRGYRMDVAVTRIEQDPNSGANAQQPQPLRSAEPLQAGPIAGGGASRAPTTSQPRIGQLLSMLGVALLAAGAVWYGMHRVTAFNQPGAVATALDKGNTEIERSIAVLPFLDLSPGRDEGFFADGMTEEITSMLSQLGDLRVTARTSTFYFKDKAVPVSEIGKILGVSHVLEGSVRQSADRLRITVQLVRTATGFHEWAADYDRRPDDLLTLQSEVARTVAEKLRGSLGSIPAFRNKLSRNPAARDRFLVSIGEFALHTNAGNAKGVDDLQIATRLDPDFALAWSVLSYGYVVSASSGVAWRELRPKALYAATRALKIDPLLSDAHVAMGQILLADWNIPAASVEARRALELEPNEYHAIRLAAFLQLATGHYAEGIGVFQDLVRREPVNYFNYYDLGKALWFDGQLPQARQAFEAALALNPGSENARACLALVTLEAGDPSAALEVVKRSNADGEERILRPVILDAMGKHAEAAREQAIAERLFGAAHPYDVAAYYARRGNAEQAMRWLDKSYQRRDPDLINIESDPLFKPLRASAHFLSFLDQLKTASRTSSNSSQ
jgi:adenylate cyclase